MTADKVTALVGKSLRSRAMMAKALCVLAEGELRDGQGERAVGSIRSLRRILGDISLMIGGDSASLSASDLREAEELVSGLDERIAAMEEAMGPETIH